MKHVIYGCELKFVVVNTSECDFEVCEDGTIKREYGGEFTFSGVDYFDDDFINEVIACGLNCLNAVPRNHPHLS
jgi:hypothetical protein